MLWAQTAVGCGQTLRLGFSTLGDLLLGEGFVLSSGFALGSGFVLREGFVLNEGFVLREGFLLSEGLVLREGFLLNEGFVLREGFLLSEGFVLNESQAVPLRRRTGLPGRMSAALSQVSLVDAPTRMRVMGASFRL